MTRNSDKDDPDKTDSRNNGRHSNGRWKKGHCPNPLGRRKAKMNKEQEFVRSIQQHSSGMYEFSRVPVEMKIDGDVVYMPRYAAVLHKQFEMAMKGSVLAQREILKAVGESDKTVAMLKKRFIELSLTKANYLSEDHNGHPVEFPPELELQYLEILSILHGLFPTSYKKP